jgi:hypothetical protein
MSEILFDHIAIAAHRMADAPAVLVGALGGTPTGEGGPSGAADLDPDADEGPIAVEFTSARAVDLPAAPELGTMFRQSPR